MDLTAQDVWRDFVTDGVPSSGWNDPRKPDIRKWGTWVEQIINAFTSNGGLVALTRDQLFSHLTPDPFTMAWVVQDPVAERNGVYQRSDNEAEPWYRVADLPYGLVRAEDTGEGAPDAIQATSSLPVTSSAIVQLVIYETNTGSPVTVSFNGNPPLTVKTNSGSDVAPGGLQSGMTVLGQVSGTTFRLLSDQVSAALLAQMESLLGEFENRYLGAHASDEDATTAAGGSPVEGASYFNSTSGTLRYFHAGDWQDQSVSLEDGTVTPAKFALSTEAYLNEKIAAPKNRRLYGKWNEAAVDIAIANAWSPAEERALISGASLEDLAQLQNRIDQATRYTGMFAPLLVANLGADVGYTAESFYFDTALTADQKSKIKAGVFVRTKHSPPWIAECTGEIQADDKRVFVSEWRREDGVGAAGTPSGGVGIKVGVADQVWGDNMNIHTTDASDTKRFVLAEWGVFHSQADTISLKGLDIVCFGPERADTTFISRGPWRNSFLSEDASQVGYLIDASGDYYMDRPAWMPVGAQVPQAPIVGFQVNTEGTEYPFLAGNAGATYWFVANGGTTRFGVATGNQMEIAPAGGGAWPALRALGADTNIHLQLSPKGTGTVLIANGLLSAASDAAAAALGIPVGGLYRNANAVQIRTV